MNAEAAGVELAAAGRVERVVGFGREVGSESSPGPKEVLEGAAPGAKEASGIPGNGSVGPIEGPLAKLKDNTFACPQS